MGMLGREGILPLPVELTSEGLKGKASSRNIVKLQVCVNKQAYSAWWLFNDAVCAACHTESNSKN